MISLTDDELGIVMEAAKPLQPHQRSAFLADVADELARYPELGPGVIHRVTAKLQREHMNPPRYRNGVTKWR
ncbi:hypothetical protein AB4Z51_03285 [Bradyrhizobium sp. 2TAF36]|uniref:hypothetical protein n=1 Tax=Bradyrhizobium sp. 2TAF36 TaxID=3233016 RepID=UPI003F8E3B6E